MYFILNVTISIIKLFSNKELGIDLGIQFLSSKWFIFLYNLVEEYSKSSFVTGNLSENLTFPDDFFLEKGKWHHEFEENNKSNSKKTPAKLTFPF